MKIIDRYIGRQILFGTVFAVVILSVVLVLGNILQKILGLLVASEIPMSTVIRMVGYILPFSLVFTVPWGFLTAILLTFGRLSADNELVSLRMAGLSLSRICAPVFGLAVLFSSLCLWINLSVAPRAEAAMASVLSENIVERPLSLFSPDQVTDRVPGYRIYVENRVDNELQNFQMMSLDGKSASTFVAARRVLVNTSPDGSALELEMFDGTILTSQPGEGGESSDDTVEKEGFSFAHYFYEISLDKLSRKFRKRRPSQMGTGELFQMADDPQEEEDDRSGFRVEAHKRFSFSLACVTFALIGIPLGVTAQRRETSIGFALSLIVAVVYFLFIILAETFKRDPSAQPHLLMWLPNVVFLGLGAALFLRLQRR